MNFRVLVGVIDLSAAAGFDFQCLYQVFDLIGEAPGLEGEIARRMFAGIEMLMEPLGRWREQAAGLPVNALALFAGLPEQRIAYARENQNMRAGTMPMGARIGADGIFFDMGGHRVSGKMQQDAARSLAACAMVH